MDQQEPSELQVTHELNKQNKVQSLDCPPPAHSFVLYTFLPDY